MSQYNGLLIVDKPGKMNHDGSAPPTTEAEPAGAKQKLPTSHDIVQQVRRWSKERRIGHTGTLDPMASGVLVLCLGAATRLVEYYQRHDKQYYAEIVLGAATDTYDAMGRITQRAPIPQLDEAPIECALAQFRGEVQQIPPVYSALKVQGESLHRKARRGETVALSPRPVTFHKLELLAIAPPNRICLRILCSAGAYVRSLAHDLGQALHSYAHLDILRREQAGPFTLADAHTMPQIESAIQEQRFADLLLPPGARLDLPQLTLDAETHTRLGFGQKTPIVTGPPPADGLAQAYTADGHFAGIIRCLGFAQETDTANPATIWKAEKWFNTES
ncbi:MAG: tRNA pseudouridine(55) synthase TruB [Caldilineaceae bacterium]